MLYLYIPYIHNEDIFVYIVRMWAPEGSLKEDAPIGGSECIIIMIMCRQVNKCFLYTCWCVFRREAHDSVYMVGSWGYTPIFVCNVSRSIHSVCLLTGFAVSANMSKDQQSACYNSIPVYVSKVTDLCYRSEVSLSPRAKYNACDRVLFTIYKEN